MSKLFKYLLIDSRDRSTGTSSNFTLYLPDTIRDVKSIKLLSVNLPNTFYLIRTGVNDRIVWNRSSTNYSYQVPAGAYTIQSLLNTIQIGMNGIDANTYSCSYSSITFLVTITGASVFTLNWSTNPNAGTSMYYELGWTKTDTSSATSQISPNAINLVYPLTFYLTISQFGVPTFTSDGTRCTFTIPITESSGDIINFSSGRNYEQKINVSNLALQTLNVYLSMRGNTIVNLDGSDWNFMLELE